MNRSTDRRIWYIFLLARIVDSERTFNGSADPLIRADRGFIQIMGPIIGDSGFWILVVWKFGSWISTSPRKAHFLFLMYRCHEVEKTTRNSIALMRDGSVMADSDLVDFLSGPMDSAINFNGSADLHTPIHPPL